jgi:hypothetical protein
MVGASSRWWLRRTVLVVAALSASGCAETKRSRAVSSHGIDDPAPLVFVTAARQRDRVEASLRTAGFRLADGVDDTPFLLRVTIGGTRRVAPCGTSHSVRYSLRRDKRTVAEVNRRGWTGDCRPNVLDEAAAQLLEELRHGAREE